MTIPEPRVEFQIGGVWTDVTDDVDKESGLTIERGRRSRGARSDPTRVALTLRGERYSTRNPMSDLYGVFGRNTPARVTVDGSESYLDLPGAATDVATTPDHSSLDIVGDIDLRAEATMDWSSATNEVLIAKWGTAGQRSYVLFVTGTILRFQWSTNGTSGFFHANYLPPGFPRRGAVRATLDVNNGAGGFTSVLYWAPTMDGPWTSFSTYTDSGVTSIFSSTAPLSLGLTGATSSLTLTPVHGRIHRAEVRSSIGGTAVASPDIRARTPGASSFTDSAGKLWTLAGATEITRRQYRATAEATSMAPRWHSSGHDVRVPVQATGLLQGLVQDGQALNSTLRRRIPSGNPVGYWPMEESVAASQCYSPLADVLPMTMKGDWQFAADDSMPGSKALPKSGSGSGFAVSTPPTGSSTGWHVEFVYKFDGTLPVSEAQIAHVHIGGSGMDAAIVYASTAGIRINLFDSFGTSLATTQLTDPLGIAAFSGVWNRMQIFTAKSGGTTYVSAAFRDVVTNIWWYVTTSISDVPGYVRAVTGTYGAGLGSGVQLGHLGVFTANGTPPPSLLPAVTIYDGADDGFQGETVIDRFARLAGEEVATAAITWRDGQPELATGQLGPQRPAKLVDLLEEMAATDGGMLYERLDRRGVAYRDRVSLYNQVPALTLDYATRGHLGPPLEPVERTADVVNDVTVKRINGSSARAYLASGPLSVLPSSQGGAGPKATEAELSLATDAQTGPLAAWRLHLGTVDDPWFAQVRVMLHAAPALVEPVLALDVGDLIRITNLPAWVSPDPVDLIVEGWSETRANPLAWELRLNCSPGRPWTVGVVESEDIGRADTDGSVLAVSVDSDDTVLLVDSDAGPLWTTDPGECPLDIRIGGETMTVTAITGTVMDLFARTVSSGWGTASSGQTWTVTGGSASDYSVLGGHGLISQGTINISRNAIMSAPSADIDITATVSTDKLATGGSQYVILVARWLDFNNFYSARLDFSTTQTVVLTLRRRVAGTETSLVQYTSNLTHAAGRRFAIRFQLDGTDLRGRVWQEGTPEPPTWQLETTDSGLTAAGSMGLRGILAATNTNVLPVTADWADFLLAGDRQRMVVTRSVNGIVKAQSAGTPVELAHPAVVAL